MNFSFTNVEAFFRDTQTDVVSRCRENINLLETVLASAAVSPSWQREIRGLHQTGRVVTASTSRAPSDRPAVYFCRFLTKKAERNEKLNEMFRCHKRRPSQNSRWDKNNLCLIEL
ncbi:hypothetical protein EVAR_68273_1 [Eumeta japonica]|uniref:Uncharacterized protein n=1 Tax=Eumeta variegata TaxID=151549 RepID=A0A4C1SJ41_EUMVA|nr:hypothetical protein EVAR_68273_1 [Eumeta japonica]